MRKIIAALLLALLVSPAVAQTCSPVPSLPDLERRTQYSITASTGPLAVGFAIYGDSSDFVDWIQVFVNGVATTAYTLTSASGSVATLCRPISDARITFNSAQTGTVQIVGARRPRRTSQFNENRGVAARDLNQVISDLVAQNRETWDWRNRVLQGVPGDSFGLLSAPAARANTLLGFDGNGNLSYLPLGPTISATAGSTFNTRGLAAATTISGTVQFIQTAGFTTIGDKGGATYVRAGGASPGGFQSADGAWWSIVGNIFWAAQFGAACDEVQDDTTAFQNMIDRAQAVFAQARFAGSCLIVGTLRITAALDFGGAGTRDTFFATPSSGGSRLLTQASAAVQPLNINTDAPVRIHDFEIRGNSSTTGALLILTAPNVNEHSIFSGLYISGAEVCFQIVRAANFVISNSFFDRCTGSGLSISDTFSGDSGDNVIYANTMDMPANSIAVEFISGGGLKFIGNKINGGGIVAFDMSLAAGVATAGLNFQNNNIEGFAISLQFRRADGVAGYRSIMIQNNKLVATGVGGRCVSVPGDAFGTNWIIGLQVQNNYCIMGGSGTGAIAGFDIGNVTGVVISGNLIDQVASVSASYPIIVGPSNANCLIGPNRPIGTFTNVSDTSCPGATVYAPN